MKEINLIPFEEHSELRTFERVMFWLHIEYKKRLNEYRKAHRKIVDLKKEISIYRTHKNGIFYWLCCQDLKEQKSRIRSIQERITEIKRTLKFYRDSYSRMMNKDKQTCTIGNN